MKRHFLTLGKEYNKMFLNKDVPVYRGLRDKKWFEETENGMMKKEVNG